jgi:integrase/recombinase XerC
MTEEYNSPIQTFLDYVKFEKRYSQHTITAYKNDLEQFFDYLSGQYGATALNEISPAFIKSWLASLKEDKIVFKIA